MVGLAILIAALFLVPFTLRVTTRSMSRRAAERRLRWHGIRWQQPDEIDALVSRALAKQRGGDVAGAIADYDLALAQQRSALVLNNRGCALLQAGEVAKAILDLKEATALDPTSATAHCSLAEAYARAGDDGAALESLRVAVGLDPHWREHARTAAEFERWRGTPEGSAWMAAR
jgi:Tfp pilus assembly protein PilF